MRWMEDESREVNGAENTPEEIPRSVFRENVREPHLPLTKK